jgi:hypothetical protein
MSEALSPHFTEIKVRGYHLDGYGHVHHPRYLEFLEEAAWRCIEKYGSIEFLVNNRLGFVIVNINIATPAQPENPCFGRRAARTFQVGRSRETLPEFYQPRHRG